MVKIVIIKGGLGNQMFSYAFTLALKHKFKFALVEIDPLDCLQVHNGFEIPLVFQNFKHRRSNRYYNTIRKIYARYPTKNLFRKVTESGPGHFYLKFTKGVHSFSIYEGYWQTEEYFKNIHKIIKKTFVFNIEKLNSKTTEILNTIQSTNSVSLHVRRGDYTYNEELNNMCTLDYYNNATHFMDTKFDKLTYFVFSDDKIWIKENFKSLNFTLVDFNEKIDNWQDMFLMSKCKHNIIANSTFSWWGAWLNENPDKIVIAPSKWFKTFNYDDIIPETWIKI